MKRETKVKPNIVQFVPSLFYWHTHNHRNTHTPISRRRGLTNCAFISCQSGFIGFKWSLITTVLQSSTTAFSSMGSLYVSAGLFPKTFLFPSCSSFIFTATYHPNGLMGLISLFHATLPQPLSLFHHLYICEHSCVCVCVCGSASTNPPKTATKMWREICVDRDHKYSVVKVWSLSLSSLLCVCFFSFSEWNQLSSEETPLPLDLTTCVTMTTPLLAHLSSFGLFIFPTFRFSILPSSFPGKHRLLAFKTFNLSRLQMG